MKGSPVRVRASASVVGRIYLERGTAVTVLARWGEGGGPRNVLIQRADGVRVVRPFRGLRRRLPAERVAGADHVSERARQVR
jgi:hypothetical protein